MANIVQDKGASRYCSRVALSWRFARQKLYEEVDSRIEDPLLKILAENDLRVPNLAENWGTKVLL